MLPLSSLVPKSMNKAMKRLLLFFCIIAIIGLSFASFNKRGVINRKRTTTADKDSTTTVIIDTEVDVVHDDDDINIDVDVDSSPGLEEADEDEEEEFNDIPYSSDKKYLFAPSNNGALIPATPQDYLKTVKIIRNTVIPVIVFGCSRVSISRCLDSLLAHRHNTRKFPIYVSLVRNNNNIVV